MIDEELWKVAHLELIHKELKTRWYSEKRKREHENWKRAFEIYQDNNNSRLLLELRDKCDKWPRSIRRRHYGFIYGYSPDELKKEREQ